MNILAALASSSKRPRFAILATLLLLAQASPVWAWGRLGHRASARFAEARLTPEARAIVRSLLEPGESLADAATWADEIRRERPETGPWHYVNVPITVERFDPKFCPVETGCVTSAIAENRRMLADTNAPVAKRREALRFLVHFLQDLHQPVHVGDHGDRGGNDLQVQFFGQGSNLHRVWDSGLIEKVAADEAALVRQIEALATPEAVAAWSRGQVKDWAEESFQAAKLAYRVPGTDQQLRPGAKLGQDYLDANGPLARRRLAQSAARLAAVLNATLH